jgi:hypothetical protein
MHASLHEAAVMLMLHVMGHPGGLLLRNGQICREKSDT